MEPAPHIKTEYHGKINERVLLHHSWDFLKERVKPKLERTVEMISDDYPMINGEYDKKGVTLVATRMGIEESVNIVDQLISLGVERFIKLGSFVALRKGVNIGDIYVPYEAVRLPGVIDAILRRDERVLADRDLFERVGEIASQQKVKVNLGGKIFSCPIYGPYIRDEVVDRRYSIDYWRKDCFGDEMECSGIFAIAKARKARSAAILVCNRIWEVLDGYRNGLDVDWNEHKNSRKSEYNRGYEDAIKLALELLK